VRTLWLPRLIEASEWIEQQVAERQAKGRTPLASEISGEATCDGILLHGRADRIDRTDTGLGIVDYKTGKAPKDRQVAEGFALQLGLLAFIAEQGGFDGVQGDADAFEYWSFQREGGKPGKISSPAGNSGNKIPPDIFVETMVIKFKEAAAKWLSGREPFTAKLNPDYARSDYDHLMRLEEWQGRDA